MKAAAILRILEGPGEGSDFPLFECVATNGSDQSNTIALDFGDGAISRIPHAAIEVEGNSATIADGGKARAIKVGSHATPAHYWDNLAGRCGYCIVRGGDIIGEFVRLRN